MAASTNRKFGENTNHASTTSITQFLGKEGVLLDLDLDLDFDCFQRKQTKETVKERKKLSPKKSTDSANHQSRITKAATKMVSLNLKEYCSGVMINAFLALSC